MSLRIKPMGTDGETFIVCHNPEEERHDRERRRELVTQLREQLRKNPSGSDLLRSSSFRGYLRVPGKAITIDETKITRSERYDGECVLRSNAAKLSHQDIVRVYR